MTNSCLLTLNMNLFRPHKRELHIDYSSEQLLSATIDWLRFPLMILIIFIHMDAKAYPLTEIDFPLTSFQGFFNLLSLFLGYCICYLAVPCFFLISGLLFFRNTPQLTPALYRDKLKRRFRSLAVPYILWNIVAVLLTLLYYWRHDCGAEQIRGLLSDGWHLFYDVKEWSINDKNWLGISIAYSGPINLPLWYIRDLIVVALCSPLVYWWVKRLKVVGLLLLTVCYVGNIWPPVGGFGIKAFYFFTLGAYFSLNRLSIIDFARRYKSVILPPALLLIILCCCYGGYVAGVLNPISTLYLQFFSVVGVFALFYLASALIGRFDLKPCRLLVSSCMFILALHAIGDCYYVMGSARVIVDILLPFDGCCHTLLEFLLVPFVSAALCVGVYALGRRCFPRLTRLFSGNR